MSGRDCGKYRTGNNPRRGLLAIGRSWDFIQSKMMFTGPSRRGHPGSLLQEEEWQNPVYTLK